MLFLVISTPQRSSISRGLIEARLAFRDWIRGLKKQILCFYPRKDRGAVVIFKLQTRRELEKVLQTWRSFIHTRLDVYPLQEPEESGVALKKALRRFDRRE